MEGTTRFDRTDEERAVGRTEDVVPVEKTGRERLGETQDDRPVGELVQQLSQQTSQLIRQEMRLAQVELQEKGKRAGMGAGMFGGASVVALYGVGALIAAAIIGVGTLIEPWISAVIVGVVLLIIAGIVALAGKKQVQRATPPLPEQALESTKRDVDEVKKARARA
jgi:membrane protein